MKIEIGESLLLSWLRHVKGCQLVQTNWKPSVTSWDLSNEVELGELMEGAATFYRDRYGFTLFKNNSFSQLLQQAEVDVLGISIGSERDNELYAIDVAFHEAGLNYGDKNETLSRVIKKIIRTAFILNGYFNATTGTIIFASPKINNAIHQSLTPMILELERFLADRGYGFHIKLYCNEEFQAHILEPVITVSNSVADTSELFMRSLQLYQLFAAAGPRKSVTRADTATPQTTRTTEGRQTASDHEIKIGALVRSTMRNLLKHNLIPENELSLLTTYDYSKQQLDINYPLLVAINPNQRLDPQRYVNGRPRYWNEVFESCNKKYFVCQEWFDRNRSYFERWMKKYDT